MQTLLIFLLFLGPLVFFHELGHFLFARLFGVRVEVFSIGFGPKILKKKIGDTVYTVSLIPLGGYVKMFGDNPLTSDELSAEEKEVAFTHKSKFAKFWIVFGGPLANFILAFVIYFSLIMGGEKVPEARIGLVKADSTYYQIGLRSGDVLKKINETEILGFDDLNLIDDNIKSITVDRSGSLKEILYTAKTEDFLKKFGEILYGIKAPLYANTKGDIYYLFETKEPTVNKSQEQIVEALTGVKEFYLYKVKTIKVTSLKQLEFDMSSSLKLEGVTKDNYFAKLKQKQLYPAELAIHNVNDGPAAKAGLQQNDIILSIDNNITNSFAEVQKHTQIGKGTKELTYKVLRDTQELEFKVQPSFTADVARIGVQSSMLPFSLGLVESKSSGLLLGIKKAYIRTQDGIVKTMMGFKKLLFGEVSIKNLGGPFAIASVAADSFSISLSVFFRLMALISINLGLINLFPIPVLDGGHIVMLGIETIYGGPLPKKILMRIQQVGVSLLFLLMFVAIFNDITRFF